MDRINDDSFHLEENWAMREFGDVNCNDVRLTKRLVKMADNFIKSPESSINQASGSCSEAKAAYRLLQNDNINESEILASHIKQTRKRAHSYKTILSIQDTCYISYKNHKATTGLGVIASRVRSEKSNFKTHGLVMHTAFAVTTEGLPIGILDQKIHSRPVLSEELLEIKKRSHGIAVPIEDKESIRWLESLKKSKDALEFIDTQVVTVCDREADIYEFFHCSHQLQSPVLVRANHNRAVNQKPRKYTRPKEIIHTEKLWEWVNNLPIQGQKEVVIPTRATKPARTARLDIRFSSFTMSPNKHIRRHNKTFPILTLQAIYVIEPNPPAGEEPLEWLLLTNLPIDNLHSALEKVDWYALRWRIETFHKILKSGFSVEECRLGTATRLMRYLTVMSIIAWRIFYMTLLARTNPELPCSEILTEEEWKILYTKIHRTRNYPHAPPSIKNAITWLARLGGFLARKGDGDPGPITLWRGWKRLMDLVDGWNLARS